MKRYSVKKMKIIFTSLLLVLAIPFLAFAEESSKASAEVSSNNLESDEPREIVFGDKFPKVLAVEAIPSRNGDWDFNVTLSSPYDSPKRYADAWRVLDGNDQQLGIRELLHDHAGEQPFTRSESIQIPKNIDTVFVEGRDQVNGWSGQRFELKTPQP